MSEPMTPEKVLKQYEDYVANVDTKRPNPAVLFALASVLILMGFALILLPFFSNTTSSFKTKDHRIETAVAGRVVPGTMAANCTCKPERCGKKCHNPTPPVSPEPAPPQEAIRQSTCKDYEPLRNLDPVVFIFMILAGSTAMVSGGLLVHYHYRSNSTLRREQLKGALDLHRAMLDYHAAAAARL